MVCNIFFNYFGQSLSTGHITSGDTKMAFKLLGPGYTACATLVNDHITDNNNIQHILDLGESTHNNNFNAFATEFFNQDPMAPTLVIAQVGPSLTITLVQLDEYPAIAADIKKDYFSPASHPQVL